MLRIRESKFHKSRLVPLSPDARSELRRYLRQRLTAGVDARPGTLLLRESITSCTPQETSR